MSKFRFNVYYNEIAVFQSSELNFADAVEKLNDVIDSIYDFNCMFGDHVIETSCFSYVIEEVE